MDEFEYKGTWWFPQFPNHQVGGTLKFHPVDGAVLETISGNFMSEMLNLFGTSVGGSQHILIGHFNRVIDIICGFTEKGDAITLYKCFWRGDTLSHGYVGGKYSVEVVFIGCHFENDEDIVFDSLSISYTFLEEWLGITGFTAEIKHSQTGEYIDGEFKYKRPERIELQINDFRLAFYHRLYIASDSNLFKDVKMKQKSFIEISSALPKHYNDYQSDIIYPLRNFLSLGMGTTVLPLLVKGQNSECVLEGSDGKRIPQEILIFYRAKGANNPIEQVSAWEMLFRFNDIAENFEKYLQLWFDKLEILRPVFDLYFGLFYIPSMYIHLEFLTLAQALESYHRRVHGGMYMTPDAYAPVAEILNQAIPQNLKADFRDSLKGRIKYGYEYSLSRRLRLILCEVLKEYKSLVDGLAGSDKKQKASFIKRLVDTRNYLTHYSKDQGQEPITDLQELYNFIERMKVIMQLCFLHELGFSQSSVMEWFSQNSRLQSWIPPQ